jgi:pyrroloquinoline quinone (PQQ) biosynthesis protein C
MTFFEQLSEATREERAYLFDSQIIKDAAVGRVTRETYIAYLVQAFHHVRHTVPLLMAAGARVPDEKAWVREAFAEYIEEEVGHEYWILNDITETGGDAEAAKHSTPNFATEMMVAYAYDSVTRGNPLSFLGMVFVLEGTSVSIATNVAETLKEKLGLTNKSFSYLMSHGSLDIKHMAFFETLVNRVIDKQDQDAIIHMAKRMFILFAEMFRSVDVTPMTEAA